MRPVRAWWMPLLLLAAPLLGWAPAVGDLPTYFAPMWAHTAGALAAGEVPLYNLYNGCGEPWFANPQTGLLYPPRWLHLVLPLPLAITTEIALHLAWLALGMGVLVQGEGWRGWGRTLVEAATWCAGPVLALVAVVSLLETLAWAPWMVAAARWRDRRAPAALALATAGGWLGGQPEVWGVAVLTALAAAHRRPRAVAGLGLGLLIVSVQLVPFLAWAAAGDRGPAAAVGSEAGAVAPAAWLDVLAPGIAAAQPGFVYAHTLFLGAPLLLMVILGARGRRRWLLLPLALGLLATLPAVGGGALYHLLTAGLVRYPGRFAILALVLLLPLMAPGVARWRDGEGRGTALVLSGAGVAAWVLAPPARGAAAALASVAVLGLAALAPPRLHWARSAAVLAGVAAAVAAGLPHLGLQPAATYLTRASSWGMQVETGRAYAPHLDRPPRGNDELEAWSMGYVNLWGPNPVVRSFAPVGSAALARHLEHIEAGERWWLDTAAARAVLLPGALADAGLEPLGQLGELTLHRNRQALALATVRAAPPAAGQMPRAVGSAELQLGEGELTVVIAAADRGWLWLSLAPAAGWQFRLDGARVRPGRGPGVLQWLEVAPGRHVLTGRYRPPLLPLTAPLSLLALAFSLAVWRGRRVALTG